MRKHKIQEMEFSTNVEIPSKDETHKTRTYSTYNNKYRSSYLWISDILPLSTRTIL